MNFAKKAIEFNDKLSYTGKPVPHNIRVLNPFREFSQTKDIVKTFYKKYYNDSRTRHLILGINPSRLGAALTGIPFTDPKRLQSELKIPYSGKIAHEPSSVFMYEMMHAYGGVEAFYGDFYINSPCPLAFVSTNEDGRQINHNYYDSKVLLEAVGDYTVEVIKKLINIGIDTNHCICLGTGKNKSYLSKLNKKHQFFKELTALEHPRYIMQYQYHQKQYFIDKYVEVLNAVKENDLP